MSGEGKCSDTSYSSALFTLHTTDRLLNARTSALLLLLVYSWTMHHFRCGHSILSSAT